MKIGYSRVSTDEQSQELQTHALTDAGCEIIYSESVSGKSREGRPELARALAHLKSGDVLVVWKLDRLGRSVADLIQIVNELAERDIRFQSITDAIDTTTTAGRFFFHVMASLAEMERELISERTRAGLSAAKAQGRIGGRPSKMSEKKTRQAIRLIESGELPRDIARTFGVSVPTLYRHLAQARVG